MSEVLAALRAALGDQVVRTGEAIADRHRTDWTGYAPTRPLAVLLPRSTEEVSAALRICNARRQAIVPQGGMTGMAAGAVPRAGDIALSVERMRAIEELDRVSATLSVQAGTTLAAAQQAAEEADLHFPLDLGARASCQIGGTIASNAGGNNVVRYGMTRELVLGLEVVLADGTVLDAMTKMIKNNAGYDLKHFFIGTEGTLGVITRAVLRLYPRPGAVRTFLCALPGFEDAIALLRSLQREPGRVAAFELMWRDFYRLGVSWLDGRPAPLPEHHPLYALVAVESGGGDAVETALEQAIGQGRVLDAVLARSEADARGLWAVREATARFPARLDPVNLDVSVPIGTMQRFIDRCRERLETRWPGQRSYFFGHAADSNLHLTVDARSIPAVPHEEIYRLVFECVQEVHGSVSGEHGIGLLKRDFLGYSRTPQEIATMRAVKRALDPHGILNPGKIFAEDAR